MPVAPLQLLHGDILEAGWADASLVFATSLCFPPALVRRVEAKAAALRLGARLLVMQPEFGAAGLFRPLPLRAESASESAFDAEAPRHCVTMRMSFGEAKFYAYERTLAEAE